MGIILNHPYIVFLIFSCPCEIVPTSGLLHFCKAFYHKEHLSPGQGTDCVWF